MKARKDFERKRLMTVGGMYYFPGLVLIRNNMLTTYYARGEFIDCLKTERLLL